MSPVGDLVDIQEILRPPSVAAAELVLPHDWVLWDTLFMRMRDGIALLMSIADRLPGVDLPRLPGGSLTDIVVKPLCGDWDRIRANGEACRTLGRGMDGLTANLVALPIELESRWSGAAATGFAVHHAEYAVAVAAVARVVEQGRLVFDGIGELSRRVGEAAIGLLTRLGLLLARVARKVASRLAPYVGWLATVKDVLVDGVGPIVDIVADIREAVDLVHALLDLVQRIRGWLIAARADLSVFTTLPTMLAGLPSVVSA
ncbi:MAG: hypothetical protein ACRCYU_05945 [Nocardioides sp.]